MAHYDREDSEDPEIRRTPTSIVRDAGSRVSQLHYTPFIPPPTPSYLASNPSPPSTFVFGRPEDDFSTGVKIIPYEEIPFVPPPYAPPQRIFSSEIASSPDPSTRRCSTEREVGDRPRRERSRSPPPARRSTHSRRVSGNIRGSHNSPTAPAGVPFRQVARRDRFPLSPATFGQRVELLPPTIVTIDGTGELQALSERSYTAGPQRPQREVVSRTTPTPPRSSDFRDDDSDSPELLTSSPMDTDDEVSTPEDTRQPEGASSTLLQTAHDGGRAKVIEKGPAHDDADEQPWKSQVRKYRYHPQAAARREAEEFAAVQHGFTDPKVTVTSLKSW